MKANLQALIACKLYKSMAHEAGQDDIASEVAQELKNYARYQTPMTNHLKIVNKLKCRFILSILLNESRGIDVIEYD